MTLFDHRMSGLCCFHVDPLKLELEMAGIVKLVSKTKILHNYTTEPYQNFSLFKECKN